MLPSQILKDKQVTVTGPESMIGRAVIDELRRRNTHIFPVKHKHFNLLDYQETGAALDGSDYVIHCAGYNGNIEFNQKYPSDIYFRTAQMGLNVLRACNELDVQKVVCPLASCAYPDSEILYEEELENGSPNSSVEAHGLSKRVLFDYSRQLHKQYGLTAVCCVFNTCYGPYDSFDVKKTKVVGGLINKFVGAKKHRHKKVECWGTGLVKREFIYVEDAAKAIVDTLEYYENVKLPINIGSGKDITIRELASEIANIVQYNGEVCWDESKLTGQERKLLSNKRMMQLLPAREFTTLRAGLEKTIEWYQKNGKVDK